MALGMVETVLGPVPAAELGVTLPHEHLFTRVEGWNFPPRNETEAALAQAPVSLSNLQWIHRRAYSNTDNMRIEDYAVVCDEVRDFKQSGGGTIVDVTLPDIGRSPALIQKLSRQTGVHVVAGCGYYVDAAHPSELATMSVEEIAEALEAELIDGIADTGIRPGIIGEIGTGKPVTENEQKVLEASALAHRRTGAPISVHLHPAGGTTVQVLDILERAGASASAVAMGHQDTQDPLPIAIQMKIAARGAYVEYDQFGANWADDDMRESYASEGYHSPPPSDQQRVRGIAELFAAGYGERVLISHDVCTKIQQAAWGGCGFSHIPRYMTPFFKANGFSDGQLDLLLRKNPQRFLTWSSPSD